MSDFVVETDPAALAKQVEQAARHARAHHGYGWAMSGPPVRHDRRHWSEAAYESYFSVAAELRGRKLDVEAFRAARRNPLGQREFVDHVAAACMVPPSAGLEGLTSRIRALVDAPVKPCPG